MKCPKCGFVSFPGIDRCKKCGHSFPVVEDRHRVIPPLFRQPSTVAGQPEEPLSAQVEGKEVDFPPESRDLNPASDSDQGFLSEAKPRDADGAGAEAAAPLDWQKELAERMQEFRRRRARIDPGKSDDETKPRLEFSPPVQSAPEENEAPEEVIEFPAFDEMNLQEEAAEEPEGDLGPLVLEKPREDADYSEDENAGASQFGREPQPQGVPMEIEMESSAAPRGIAVEGNTSTLQVAPLAKRFLAGLFDLAVLLCAAGVFALVFWQAGGQIRMQPLNLAPAGAAGLIILMGYFGGFTVLTHATPGLIWAGLEVRTFAGLPPKRSDCLWRSFGYLVSVSALLLGFIWALVDGEGLTWHDRMSRTLLVTSQESESLEAAPATT